MAYGVFQGIEDFAAFSKNYLQQPTGAELTYHVGSLAPGESKTLTYTVNVEPGVFMAAGNEKVPINNRARIFTDDKRDDGNNPLNAYNCYKSQLPANKVGWEEW